MPNIEEPTRRAKRRGKDKNRQSLFVPICILLLVILAGAGIYFIGKPQQQNDSSSTPDKPSIVAEQIPAQDEPTPTVRPAPLETTAPDTQPQAPEEIQRIEEPGITGPVMPGQTAQQNTIENECELLGNQLYNFFIHIDSEEYMKSFALEEPSQAYFTRLAYKLLDNPPIISRESDDLYTILKNMAHFFRVIGKNNIIIIKTILDRERDKIEDVASELYQWIIIGDCRNDRFEFASNLDKAYEYAGFFLNTLGGQAYLFRRESNKRLLAKYYCIMVIDRANAKIVNRHGIDIIPPLDSLVKEMELSETLIYREQYLRILHSLQDKYQASHLAKSPLLQTTDQ